MAVFEAAIDAMAEMTLAGSAADKYRLSLGGIYVPEQSHTIKPPAALEEFLRRHPHVVRMELCLDNDPPGRTATAVLASIMASNMPLPSVCRNQTVQTTVTWRRWPCGKRR